MNTDPAPMEAADPTATPFLVLIADDEAPIASVIAEVVTDLGCTPLVAAHGVEALELARQQWPALLITDLMMPHLTGAELIAAMRTEAARQNKAMLPSILMTAAAMSHARAAQADALLPKPFDLVDLEALLRRFLDLPQES